jgi:hypothetical protein
MSSLSFYIKFNKLPESIKKEILDFMEFLIQKYNPKKTKKHPQPGCMKGVFKMHDDFDEPLDDFKEYM